MTDEFIKKGWFELTANILPAVGANIQKLGKTVFTTENMELLEDILKQAKDAELNPETADTIKYIWLSIRRLTESVTDANKTK